MKITVELPSPGDTVVLRNAGEAGLAMVSGRSDNIGHMTSPPPRDSVAEADLTQRAVAHASLLNASRAVLIFLQRKREALNERLDVMYHADDSTEEDRRNVRSALDELDRLTPRLKNAILAAEK